MIKILVKKKVSLMQKYQNSKLFLYIYRALTTKLQVTNISQTARLLT